jgi:hypothetical protein
MKTLKKKVKNNNTLKNKLTTYFCETKEKDICCESEYNRPMIVEEIISMYKKKDYKYLESIENDIIFFVGFRIDLEKAKNKEGLKMWDYIAAKTKNKKLSEVIIKTLLMELPLYYLLAFLGNTYLKFKSYST